MVTALTVTLGGIYLNSSLPNVEELTEIPLQLPLNVYSKDGKLISQFGEYRRNPVHLNEVPQDLINAFLATEDSRFYHHAGVDFIGLVRAARHMLMGGGRGQGGSTITMQLARNYYLSPQKTFVRKFNEILLALKIEREFSKDQILELYLNKIYLGNRAYGINAAAQVYYGKTLDQLSLAEMATIAGLPQAPSRLNPIHNPSGAKTRRNHVLERMYGEDFIDKDTYEAAIAAPMTASYHGPRIEVQAAYAAEMVRQQLFALLGDKIYIDGLKVYTTIDSREQLAANTALENGLMTYDLRRGYRGPIQSQKGNLKTDEATWIEMLKETVGSGPLDPGLVLQVQDQSAQVMLRDEQTITLDWNSLSWARPDLGNGRMGAHPKRASDILKPGDLIYVFKKNDETYRLAQVPQVQGALVAMDPRNGAIEALTGGFDFYINHYNAANQAKRQPGSSFKPFIYSAALEHGFTAASIINDAPVVFEDVSLKTLWRPQNDNERFSGPTSLRMGLVRSRNLVSIRLLDAIGIDNAIAYAGRFGFDVSTMPHGLSLALGTLEATPLEMATAFSVFANGGYKVTPYLINYVADTKDVVLMRSQTQLACTTCDPLALAENNATPAPQVISTENAYIMTDILKDVIKHGTGRGALVLERADLGGKTGSTNDHKDAWFVGFNSHLVASVWMGYDRNRNLGEYASQVALPIWVDFMREALRDTPDATLPQPADIVHVRIDPRTGLLAPSGDPYAIFELFTTATAPKQTSNAAEAYAPNENQSAPESLF